MSLKERISVDINRVFMQSDHFAETHYWNGQAIICVPDDEESLKRTRNTIRELSWDNNRRYILIHTPLEGFPGGREPEVNTQIMFDRKSMTVMDVQHNMGMLDIQLMAFDPREMI